MVIIVYLSIFMVVGFLFGPIRRALARGISWSANHLARHFRRMFNLEEHEKPKVLHPVKLDGTWDMRYSVNK